MASLYRQLVLAPADTQWVATDYLQWVTQLQQLGMLGESIGAESAQRFLIGEAFLQLFSFMGCAPSIEFIPQDRAAPDWQNFVFIQLSARLPEARWLVDTPSAKPGCPACQRRQRDWRDSYSESTHALRCPHCQQANPVCRWRWYDAGGCARQFISIVNVYPKESLPTDDLLSQLASQTGTAWGYFYLHAPLILK